MKRVIFKRVAIQNFLSIGNEPVIIDFKHGVNLITGVNLDKPDRVNGTGKCVDPKTEIEISIDDPMVMEKFKKFTESSK